MSATGRIDLIDQFIDVMNRYNDLPESGHAFERIVLNRAMKILAEEIELLAKPEATTVSTAKATNENT